MSANTATLRRDEARDLLDRYYASALDCAVSALHTDGWTRVVAAPDGASAALECGMRPVVCLLAPVEDGAQRAGPCGVASIARELYPYVSPLLAAGPRDFFQPASLTRLDLVMRERVARLAPGCEPRLCVWYACDVRAACDAADVNETRATCRWADWIGPLDPATETDPYARALLAQHGGGVYAARVGRAIVAYTGFRAYSARVWEMSPPTLTASAHVSAVTRPDTLLRALLARATRAALDAAVVPVCTTTFREVPLRRSLVAAGYRHYAHVSAYAALAA